MLREAGIPVQNKVIIDAAYPLNSSLYQVLLNSVSWPSELQTIRGKVSLADEKDFFSSTKKAPCNFQI